MLCANLSTSVSDILCDLTRGGDRGSRGIVCGEGTAATAFHCTVAKQHDDVRTLNTGRGTQCDVIAAYVACSCVLFGRAVCGSITPSALWAPGTCRDFCERNI